MLVGDVVQQAFTVTEAGELEDPLTDEITSALATVPDAGGPLTVSLGPDLGGYRVEAVPVTLGSRSGGTVTTWTLSRK